MSVLLRARPTAPLPASSPSLTSRSPSSPWPAASLCPSQAHHSPPTNHRAHSSGQRLAVLLRAGGEGGTPPPLFCGISGLGGHRVGIACSLPGRGGQGLCADCSRDGGTRERPCDQPARLPAATSLWLGENRPHPPESGAESSASSGLDLTTLQPRHLQPSSFLSK